MIRILPLEATDKDIKDLIIEWNELLAKENYTEALFMFPTSNEENDWTPELLKECINGYGVINGDIETLEFMLEEYKVDEFKISSLLIRDDCKKIINESIEVDRENLYGLNSEDYLGMVHFNDVPLCGYLSDLTARFHIKKINKHQLTLEFLDVHVM